MEGKDVVYIKVFDEKRGDVVFEGKVSTDVEPHELVYLRCFGERGWNVILNKETNERVRSFKGLHNVELDARGGAYLYFLGVLYVGADEGVSRKSARLCECVMMFVYNLSHEECEKVFKCETLEELEVKYCNLTQVPKEIGWMKKLKKLRLYGLDELKSMPEEMGELSNLEELHIEFCGVESLPKRLKELKKLGFVRFMSLPYLEFHTEDLVVFSKLEHFTICWCNNAFTPSFKDAFWEMIKSTTDVLVLELTWQKHDGAMVVEALEENGSIVDGRWGSESYAQFFKRNKENHERAMECVVHLLAIRRWRNALNNVPKEMVTMIAMMLWNTKCDVGAWSKTS